MLDVALKSYFLTPASEPKLTNPDEVHEATRGLKVTKTPGPNGIPNRVLKHLLQRVVFLPAQICNAVVLTHHFPQVWKDARLFSILKPGKDPALPSSYWPISLLDTIGKLFEEILLARILHVVSERGLIRDEQFGSRPRHSTSLQLARFVERITRNVGVEGNQRGFLRRGQSFRHLLDRRPPVQTNAPKLPFLHSPQNLILPQGSEFRSVLRDGHVISSRHAGWGSSGWIDLPCPLQSVCQRHALTLAPRRVVPLRGRHGHRGHVRQADVAHQLP